MEFGIVISGGQGDFTRGKKIGTDCESCQNKNKLDSPENMTREKPGRGQVVRSVLYDLWHDRRHYHHYY